MQHLVRPFTRSDIDRLVPAFGWLVDPPGDQPREGDEDEVFGSLCMLFEDPDGTALLAEDTETKALLGFCTIYCHLQSVRYGRRAWVEDLAVDPKSRSRGIGKSLLAAAKLWAVANQATHLELDSPTGRIAAHRFFRREFPTWETVCFGWRL